MKVKLNIKENRIYTEEQQEYRNNILRIKANLKKPKQAQVRLQPVEITRLQYMKNCISRIEWYENGGNNLDDLYNVLLALEKHTNNYIIDVIKLTTLNK